MTTQIPPREWEILSAYLDGELNKKESEQLEARMQVEANLSHALETLRSTRAILRSQPMQRAPRNFTLTPNMAGLRVGAHAPSSAFPVMRLASVLATLFLVLLTAGNLIAGRMQPARISQAELGQQPAFGMGGGGGGGGGFEPEQSLVVPVEKQAELLPTPTNTDTTARDLEVTPLPAAPDSLLMAPNPIATPAVEQTSEALSAIPEEQSPEALQLDQAAESEAVIPGLPIIGFLQVLLAVMAIATGAIAFYLRRKAY